MNKLIKVHRNGLMIKIVPVSNVIKEIIGSSLFHDHNELVIKIISNSYMTKMIIDHFLFYLMIKIIICHMDT